MSTRIRRPGIVTAVALTVSGALLAAGAVGQAQAAPSGAPASTATVLAAQADPTPDEQQKLREIAASIWTPELAAGWNMNADVADVLSQATDRIIQCSAAYALVPKPPGFRPGLGYLVSYWKNIRDYFLAVRGDRQYKACVVSTAAYYRSIIEMASAGI
ncbi:MULTISPECIES: hypothetical protein [Streptomyces]|uniref:Uncharacterized protein n=1 Tax=Streptomyces tsukubensis (strain DSM 42081 / NBRC 108919 / NRRL 18488 / 9993) TaxID=1114943 RepID=I2MTH9_STRT9|nr:MULTISPECIES: hypothetical protein [Streptomyces]AZK92659.1 hypothetical protein B7R87_01160 [Streptomyces tsukubensis]EIF88076.1 hypothetical protein [Streptomyces tsukubensis NRRL18488]MYS66205.1 hypothetical protein [Streptomyces sp. SID5473]QKM71170.1 hypothetical protein STSU_032715 [Streptomyces tsukubensis NRRL18488]TAI40643.1 hypothetical protein EWI31_31490 [Streptomyces tsukubensis]